MEIIGTNFQCNLADVHANLLDPLDFKQQEEAFTASTLAALPLLKHEFDIEQFKYSRDTDPIIGICITGLFDFFVHLFGEDWLLWWKEGRSKTYKNADYFLSIEKAYLERWRNIVKETVTEFCQKHNIKVPNRYTAIAPSGTKSLLTGASPGWHPPKDTRFIRRVTFAKDNPVALACVDYGYTVVPSQSCKDEFGSLLKDINDPRVTEVLVAIPVEVSWVSLADKVNFRTKDISALAQLDFYMQVQTHWTGHNTSGTFELFEREIEPLAEALHKIIQNDEGYVSVAMMPKEEEGVNTHPLLPFEPISKERYIQECQDVLSRRTNDNFLELVNFHTTMMEFTSEAGSAGCDSDKCLMPEKG